LGRPAVRCVGKVITIGMRKTIWNGWWNLPEPSEMLWKANTITEPENDWPMRSETRETWLAKPWISTSTYHPKRSNKLKAL
jgi:hypothetical protein